MTETPTFFTSGPDWVVFGTKCNVCHGRYYSYPPGPCPVTLGVRRFFRTKWVRCTGTLTVQTPEELRMHQLETLAAYARGTRIV